MWGMVCRLERGMVQRTKSGIEGGIKAERLHAQGNRCWTSDWVEN